MSRAKSDFVDWASCLHPFGEDPYGPALPHDPVCAAIREARREDDPGLPQGVWERELKRADWDKALSLSLGVLRERSKDMQVAGWACEAALMRYGFASLPGGLRMIAGLCSGFGDGLHPQPEGSDQEARLARLAWLDSTLAERAASLPITEVSPDVPAATVGASFVKTSINSWGNSIHSAHIRVEYVMELMNSRRNVLFTRSSRFAP